MGRPLPPSCEHPHLTKALPEPAQVYWTTMWKNAYPRLFGKSPLDHSDSKTSASAPPTYLPHAAPPPQTRLTFQPQMAGMMAPQGQEVVGTDTCKCNVLPLLQCGPRGFQRPHTIPPSLIR